MGSRSSVRRQVLLPFAGGLLGLTIVLAALAAVVSWNAAGNELERRASSVHRVVQHALARRQVNLETDTRALAGEARLSTATASRDRLRAAQVVTPFAIRQQIGHASVHTGERTLFVSARTERLRLTIARRVLGQARYGIRNSGLALTTDGTAALFAAAPVRGPDGETAGAVLLGDRVDDAMLAVMARPLDAQISLRTALSARTRSLTASGAQPAGGGRSFTYPVAVTAAGPTSAELIVALSDRPLRDAVRNAVLAALATGLLVGLILVALVNSLLSRSVLAPLRSLGAALGRLEHGDVDTRVQPTGAVELRRVTDGFNEMAEAGAERRRLEERLHQTQRLESVGKLAGGIAHDFNNLLAIILNYTDFVRDALPPGGTPRADLAEIRGAAERGAGLTRQLLIFSRRDLTRPEVLDLRTVAQDLETLLRRTLGEQLTLRVLTSAQPATVLLDRAQAEQILLNLAVNARDAMLDGGGTLTIATQVVELEAGDDRLGDGLTPGTYVHLQVTDDGCGMPPAVATRAFEPFFSTKPAERGTGLGLATVYGIATGAGGTVQIASVELLGTRVDVMLPYAAPPAHRDADPADRRPARAVTPGTILVAEDEDAIRSLVARVLRGVGYDVIAASSGEDLLRRLHEREVPVIALVTDLVMSGMTGKQLADRVHLSHPDVPVVFMSGYTDDVLIRHGAHEQDAQIVHKPFAAGDLIGAVARAIGDRGSPLLPRP